MITLAENMPFPFAAKVVGETVEVVGIDDSRSDMKTGVIAKIRKGNKEYGAALSELEVPQKLKDNKWFEMYEYWKQGY